jgi:hypothetical protein
MMQADRRTGTHYDGKRRLCEYANAPKSHQNVSQGNAYA